MTQRGHNFFHQTRTVFYLFRYASKLDVLLLTIGIFSAILHGVALPLSMHFFGLLTNAFVNQFTSKQLANFEFHFNPVDFLTIPRFAIVDPNLILSGFINFTNLTGGVVNCSKNYILLPPVLNFDQTLELGVTELAECLEDDDFQVLVNRYVLSFVGIALCVMLVAGLQIVTFQVSAERQARRVKEKFVQAVLDKEEKWFDDIAGGEISSRLSNDMAKIQEGMGDQLSISIQWLTTFLAGFVIGFVREWRLTLLLLVITPLVAITVIISSSIVLVLTSKEQRELASASASVEEAINAIKTVVAFGGESGEAQRYEDKLRIAGKTGKKKGVTVSFSLGLIYFFIFLCYSVGFWFSGWLLSREIIQAGDVLTVFFSVLIGIFSLGQAVPNLQNFFSAVGASVAVCRIITEKSVLEPEGHELETQNLRRHVSSGIGLRSTSRMSGPTSGSRSPAGISNAGMSSARMSGSAGGYNYSSGISSSDKYIEFKNVNFSYPSRPDIPILKNFYLSIKKGQTVALVGSSGSGKSTIIQLLLKFYTSYSGQIIFNGKDIHSLDTKYLRAKLGFVGQEPVLFDTTIEKNIKLGNLAATTSEMEEAAATANAHSFITSDLPEKYDTYVGKQGTQLSGGQKQRIALARALIRKPAVLLLDDTTSALDAESELIVQRALDGAQVGRTTIVISHRLSTIVAADVVAYVRNGRVMEFGTHQYLISMEGHYASVIHTQFGSVTLEEEEGTCPTMQSSASPLPLRDMEDEAIIADNEHFLTRNTKKKKISSFSWLRIWQLSMPEAWMICLAFVGVLVQGTIYPVFAVLFGQVLRVFTLPFNQVLQGIHVWAGMFLVLGLLSGTATFAKNLFFCASEQRLTFRLRSRTFRSILRQEMSWFDLKENSPTSLTTQLSTDAAQIPGATGIQFGTLVETAVSMLVAVVISLAVDQYLSLVIIGFLPFLILPGLLQLASLSAYTSRYKKKNEHAEKIALDAINNHLTVHALSVEGEFTKMYQEHLHEAYKFSAVAAVAYGLMYGFSQAIVFFGYAITFQFGAYQSVQPIHSSLYARFEYIYTVFMALIFGSLALGQANGFAPNYSKAKQAAKRVFYLLDRESSIDSTNEDGTFPVTFEGEVSLVNVFHSYPTRPGVNVMAGLNYTAAAGKTSALAGPSGCGKSTIIALILRFHDPKSGCVKLDGIDIRLLNLRWLRSNMSIVFQEPVLFDRTLKENIAYGLSVSTKDVEEAAKDANIHDFIQSLPLGYQTIAGQLGTQLSRGQKQRIAIARALIRHPKLLLLDEATSALDVESEKEVQRVLDQAVQNRSSIIVSHRLTTIQDADKITVLRKGKIVEEGRHTDLMDKRGLYNKMYNYQTVTTEL